MIIDCHGHYTTAPKALEHWRQAQIAGIANPSAMPKAADLKISDDALRESIESNQLKLMRQRGCDLTIFSPRASFMAHHIGDFQVSATWAAICNELCFRVAQLFPDHFIPAAMLPQSPGVDPATCLPEFVKCIEQYGNVAINLTAVTTRSGYWQLYAQGGAVPFTSNLNSPSGANAIVATLVRLSSRLAELPSLCVSQSRGCSSTRIGACNTPVPRSGPTSPLPG